MASPKEVYSYIGNSDPTWVRCKYDGYPLPFVTMRFKDKLLDNATTVAEVKLKTDALKHFGVYKCHAKNKFGSTNHSVELKLASEKNSFILSVFVKQFFFFFQSTEVPLIPPPPLSVINISPWAWNQWQIQNFWSGGGGGGGGTVANICLLFYFNPRIFA